MRGSLSDEVAAKQKLPRDLEAQVFRYLDRRAAQRPAKKRGKQAPAGGEGAPPNG